MSIACRTSPLPAAQVLAITCVALFGLVPRDAAAVQLFRYDFASNTNPSSVVSGMSATPIAASNLTANVASNVYQTSGYSSTFDTSQYFEFTATANFGNVLNISSLAFTPGMQSGEPAAVVASARSSVDSFASSICSQSVGPNDFLFNQTIDLSGSQYQGLPSITFRYYGTSPSAASQLYYDAVNLNGAVAVPEPSTCAALLGGLACGGFLMVRRRTRIAPLRIRSRRRQL